MELVAQILRVANVPCGHDISTNADTILAGSRWVNGEWRWTVRIVRRRFSSHEEIRIGPAEDDGPGLRVRSGSDERQLVALVIVQSLRVDARNLLTAEEIHAAGLADCIDHD
jgi:hypothetical protein